MLRYTSLLGTFQNSYCKMDIKRLLQQNFKDTTDVFEVKAKKTTTTKKTQQSLGIKPRALSLRQKFSVTELPQLTGQPPGLMTLYRYYTSSIEWLGCNPHIATQQDSYLKGAYYKALTVLGAFDTHFCI